MDTNVTLSGKTYLFGVECDYGDSGGRWMITDASGWVDSGAACRADTELPAGSHHVQMKYHIANAELIYDEVVIDDGKFTESFSEKSGGGPRSLNWGDGILLNFQLDNNGSRAPSGSTTLQLQQLTFWEWNQ